MTGLEFGIPQTAEQALIRLPTRNHSLYQSDEVFQHVTHFGERLIELQVLQAIDPEFFQDLSLEDRLIPLTAADIHFIGRLSFRISEPGITIAQWEFIRPKTDWGQILPSGDDCYRWWKISRMAPDLNIGGLDFISIESNRQFSSEPTFLRGDQNSEFELGLLKPKEVESLVTEITRFGR